MITRIRDQIERQTLRLVESHLKSRAVSLIRDEVQIENPAWWLAGRQVWDQIWDTK